MRLESEPLDIPVFESFEEFVTECSDNLFRLAVLLTGEREMAEDLLQTALVRVVNRWFVAKQNPVAYTRKVLINLHRNAHRDSLRRPKEVAGSLAPDPQIQDSSELNLETRDWIMRGLDLLPPRQKEVIILRFYSDLTVAATATAMGTSQGTIKSYVSRACENLRQLLQPDMEENDANRRTT